MAGLSPQTCENYEKLDLFSTDCNGNHPIDMRRLRELSAGMYLLLFLFGCPDESLRHCVSHRR